MWKKMIYMASALALVAGCVSVQQKPLSADAAKKLEQKSLTSTAYTAKPDFAAMTAGKAMFGVLGAVAMISAGNTLVAQNHVDDPALNISGQLSTLLMAKRNMQLRDELVHASKDDVPLLVAASKGGDYLLDVKTLGWGFGYFPTNWDHYRVSYSARMRLIDIASKAVVAESLCNIQYKDEAHAPSKDQLLTGEAALLKKMLNSAADDCTQQFAAKVLMI